MIRDPKDDEWQEAVDSAWAHQLLADARLYGLVRGGPEVNTVRCQELLERGRQRGVVPSQEAVNTAIARWCELGLVRH